MSDNPRQDAPEVEPASPSGSQKPSRGRSVPTNPMEDEQRKEGESHRELPGRRDPTQSLIEGVGQKEARKIRARQRRSQRVWFGLGMFGAVGWSIVVPTLAGIAIGIWIDHTWPSQYSFTLMGLIGGLLLGIYSAWYWVNSEGSIIRGERDDQERKRD
jgi:ATP synthase protein I